MSKRPRISDAELRRRLETLRTAGLTVCRVIFSPSGEAEVIVASDGIAAAKADEAEAAWDRWSSPRKEAPR